MRSGELLLLVQRQGEDDTARSWVLPGGLVEGNESLLDAFRREVREKTGLIVDVPERLVYIAHV
jgi:8-oxo-dGTP diphosphatase